MNPPVPTSDDRLFRVLVIAAFALLAARLSAQTIINPSFEFDTVPANSVNRSVSTITGWTLSTNSPDLANSTLAADLSQYVFLFAPGTSSTAQEFVSQSVTDTPGQVYTVSFYLRGGSQNDWTGGNYFAGFSPTWLANSSDGSGLTWTGSSAALTFQVQLNSSPALNVVNPGTSAWTLQHLTFTGTGSDTLTFQNLGDTAAGASYTVFSLDNVSIQAIPEPTTAALLLLGASVLYARRRR